MKKTGKNVVKREIPWGIFAGSFAIIWSFLLIAVVAVFIISGMMFAEAGSDDGLRQSWWLLPLYIGETVTGLGCAICILLYSIRENKKIK